LTEWDKILLEKEYSPEEPDGIVIDFTYRQGNNKIRVLDLACGGGRHVVYMARKGLEVTGTDISGTGLKMTRERLNKENLTAGLVRSAMNALPFVDSTFEAVICTRAIHHQKLRGIQQTLLEIKRVLSEDGMILIDFLSRRTYSHGKGIEIENETFMETEGHEKGVIHHFTNEEELQELFEGFAILTIDLHEMKADGKLRSRLAVRALKH